MKNLAEFNKFFYGEYDVFLRRREGGLYKTVELMLGQHNIKSRLAFRLLITCAKEGRWAKNREYEKEFLFNGARYVCKYLKIDYNYVLLGILELWGDIWEYEL